MRLYRIDCCANKKHNLSTERSKTHLISSDGNPGGNGVFFAAFVGLPFFCAKLRLDEWPRCLADVGSRIRKATTVVAEKRTWKHNIMAIAVEGCFMLVLGFDSR